MEESRAVNQFIETGCVQMNWNVIDFYTHLQAVCNEWNDFL